VLSVGVGGDKVSVAEGGGEFVAGVCGLHGVRIGVKWAAGFFVQIIGVYVDYFANPSVVASVGVIWSEVDLNVVPGCVWFGCGLGNIGHCYSGDVIAESVLRIWCPTGSPTHTPIYIKFVIN
jgi:hypothetical protein